MRKLAVIFLFIFIASASWGAKHFREIGYEINGPTNVLSGDTFELTIKGVNTYPKSGDIKLMLPDGLDYVSATPETSIDGTIKYLIKAGSDEGNNAIVIIINSVEKGTQIYVQRVKISRTFFGL
jgi:hypothetical protein